MRQYMRQYIAGGTEFNTREKHVGAPLLKRVFTYEGSTEEKAAIEISAAGFYRLFLNGRELTKGFFAPYISNPDHIIYYDEYDVTGLLKERNALCILLGNGFNNALDGGIWDFEKAPYRSAPKVYLRLSVGGREILTTDESFEVFDSPITFDDLRCGERFDARLIREGLLGADGLKTGGRRAVCVSAPKGEYRKCAAQPIKAFETIRPISVTESGAGYIYDFGQINAGLCRLKIDGKSGQTVDMTFGEVLQNGKLDLSNISFGDRSFEGYVQHDQYICRDGVQEYLPSFTYHGFRYVEVKGITKEQATKDLLEYVVIHSDIPPRGRFSCSDETVNRIQECALRSDTSNFYYFPTDCPQREKNGWTADASLSAEQLLYNFDCAASLREWLNNIRKAQTKEGALPGIVPTSGWGYEWGNGPAWDSVLIELPYQLYRFTGDKEVIEENAEAIERYFDYLETKKNGDGLFDFGLGDWCEAGMRSEDAYSTPLEVTDSLVCIELAKKAESMFLEIGKTEKAEKAAAFGKGLKEAFRKKYVSAAGEVSCGTQTAQALAIVFGVFSETELPAAYVRLAALLKEKGGHLQTGVLGAKVLFDALTKGGYAEEALYSIVRKDFPGYAYNLGCGATTLWEGINELETFGGVFRRKDGGRLLSLNHHFWGSVSAWFYRAIGGLDVKEKGRVEISPAFVASLDWAEAEYADGERFVKVRWERKGGEIFLDTETKGFVGNIGAAGYMFENGEAREELKEGKRTYRLVKN